MTPVFANTPAPGACTGFSFIELLVALAVLGLLLAVSSDYYGQAITKTIGLEAFTASSAERNHVQEHYSITGRWPEHALPAAPTGSYDNGPVNPTVLTDNGAVTARFLDDKARRLGGSDLGFRPLTRRNGEGMTLRWHCGPGALDDRYEPSGPDRTNLPKAHRTAACRSPLPTPKLKTAHE